VKDGCAAKGVGFHTTRWSVVISAGQRASPNNQAALAELCTHYWYPIYAFARRNGAIKEAEALVEISEERRWCAELNRLRGMFLASLDADETQIEASFRAAITIAREQKSPPLVTRAEASYAEYRSQRATAAGVRDLRLPLF
jgi:hypothetical protein